MNRLLDVTEELLRTHSHHDLAERAIAEIAQVSVPMIHYYFGDKDGLLFAVIVRYTDEVIDKVKALERIDPAAPLATRAIVKVFTDAFYTKPWITLIAVSEFSRPESAIKQFFTRKYGPQGQALVIIRRTFTRLIDAGVYDRRVNSSHAAVAMMSVIVGPFLFGSMLWGGEAAARKEVIGQEWVDYVGDLFAHRYPKAG